MKNCRHRFVLYSLCLLPMLSIAQEAISPDASDARMEWWREARFGMFIHWGIYSILEGEWEGQTDYGEWIRNNAQIPLETYDTLRRHFNPVRFDADEWASLAKRAGMKYMVLTSKHHDGFCLFDSEHTEFDVMSTPFKRDIVAELAEACRKHGIVFGLYHSIMDWHHPDYLPRRIWETDRSPEGAEYSRYVAYMKSQVRELLTRYGPIGIMWFDGEWESTWTEAYGTDMYEFVRGLQPDIVVNNRVGASREGMAGTTAAGKFGGDFGTPEQQVPATGMPGVDWESCMTMNENWGFNRADTNFKSVRELLRTLIDIASKGGNYLLNVGPTSDGAFPQASIDRLKGIGDWMAVNGRSIYGTSASPFEALPWGRSTVHRSPDGVTIYFHVFDWPADGSLAVPGLMTEPRKAYLLDGEGTELLTFQRDEDAIVLNVPAKPSSDIATVVALEFDGVPEIHSAPPIMSDVPIFLDTLTVAVPPSIGDIQIRYSLDGTIPQASSPSARGSIRISATAQVSVRYFRGNDPVSPVRTAQFRKVRPMPAHDVPDLRSGLSYAYFEGEWDSIPDFDSIVPARTGIVEDFLFDPRREEEHFGFVYDGYVHVPETDVYTFSTASDDGSRLWIGDVLVVDNDGLHGMREQTGLVALEKGHHPLRVEYFERTGSDGLRVFMGRSSTGKKQLHGSSLWRRQSEQQ